MRARARANPTTIAIPPQTKHSTIPLEMGRALGETSATVFFLAATAPECGIFHQFKGDVMTIATLCHCHTYDFA